MLYQCALRTTVPQRIRHKDPYAAAERERLEERATQSAADHDHTGCHRKAPLYAGQSVSVINNDRTLWLPATIVRAADHGSYIVKVIGGAEYRRARDHIREPGLSLRIFRHSYCGRVVQKSHSSTPKFTHPHIERTKYANVSEVKP